MSTIAYDKPVADFIAGLNATGHVTHTSWRKKSVTFHHNAGRLSLQGILDVWKVRPASAHFQVDRAGALGQYVKVDEYAWACGNRTGNQESISIEMANETLSPEWQVNDVTLTEAARLAGWLFANVIKAAPTKDNVHMHSHWLATSCAGPWVKARFANVLADVQAAYAEFSDDPGNASSIPPVQTKPPKPKNLDVDGKLGPATITRWQQVMGTTADGVISQPSSLVRAVQRHLNTKLGTKLTVDGLGIRTNNDGNVGPTYTIRALQRYLGQNPDGVLSHPTSKAIKALQARLNEGKF